MKNLHKQRSLSILHQAWICIITGFFYPGLIIGGFIYDEMIRCHIWILADCAQVTMMSCPQLSVSISIEDILLPPAKDLEPHFSTSICSSEIVMYGLSHSGIIFILLYLFAIMNFVSFCYLLVIVLWLKYVKLNNGLVLCGIFAYMLIPFAFMHVISISLYFWGRV